LVGKRLLIAYLSLSVVLVSSSFVRSEHLPVKVYTSADGLGSSFIDYLMRDSRGFMWFCTRDGLSRFDGSQFVTYQVGDEGSPGVETIFEARNGVYWIGTTGGMYRFNPAALTTPRVTRNGRPILNAEWVSSWRGVFYEDRKGRIWFTGLGVYLMEEKDGQVVFNKVDLNLPAEENKEYGVNAIYEGADGSFWFNTTFGIVRRLPDDRTVFYPYRTGYIEGLTRLMMDKQNRLWLKLGSDLFVIKPEPLESLSHLGWFTIRDITPTTSVAFKIAVETAMPAKPGEILQILGAGYFDESQLKNIYETSDGNVWLITEKDLFEFDGRMFHRFNASQGLAPNMASMAEDSAGNLWLTGQTGLVRLDRKGLTAYREADGLSSSKLNSIYEAREGSLYISNGNFNISKLSGNEFQTVKLAIPQSAKSLWTSRSVFLDSKGEWWAMTTEGLFRFPAVEDFKSLNNRPPLAVYKKLDGLKGDSAYQVFEDRHGDLWVSTRGVASECGLARWSRSHNKFYTFSESDGLPIRESAASFAEENNGNLWFGFYEGGLARYKDGRFTFFEGGNLLGGAVILDLLVDRKGRLWIASARGLFRLDDTNAEHPEFASYTTNEGLSSNNIRTITESSSGDLYAGTVRGVDRISPETGRTKHFTVSDGLASDFVIDSRCDSDGTLWFATVDGLSKLVPSPGEDSAEPQVWLGALKISGLPQALSQLGSESTESLELTHNQNNFQIDFFGLDFRVGETLRYQYKLEGSNADWSPPSELRSVTFANLSSGSYRFLVRAVNSDGIFSSKPAIVTFTILPPIWLRWWFITLALILLVAVVFGVERQRFARRRERQRAQNALRQAREERLRELETVRRRIAADLHDDIGSNLTRIALISEVAQRRLDGDERPAGEYLSNIGKLSRELVDSMSEIVWAINPNKDHFGDLSQRMRHFASDLLTAREIDFRFRALDFDPDIKVGANFRREFFLIFKEAINNVARHSGCTEVDIELRVADRYLMLNISDNGKGFDSTQASLGHGLVSMRERTRSLGGEVEIKSACGHGASLKFSIPLVPGADNQAADPA
jgi:signal transduction histidine kinase/ligand-binding sensor domain-containing protein